MGSSAQLWLVFGWPRREEDPLISSGQFGGWLQWLLPQPSPVRWKGQLLTLLLTLLFLVLFLLCNWKVLQREFCLEHYCRWDWWGRKAANLCQDPAGSDPDPNWQTVGKNRGKLVSAFGFCCFSKFWIFVLNTSPMTAMGVSPFAWATLCSIR